MHLYPCKQVINNKEKNKMTLITGESHGFKAFASTARSYSSTALQSRCNASTDYCYKFEYFNFSTDYKRYLHSSTDH